MRTRGTRSRNTPPGRTTAFGLTSVSPTHSRPARRRKRNDGQAEPDGFRSRIPGTDLELRHHTLDDVKGVFTNLLNGAVSHVLEERFGYERLLIYQDGCVYLTERTPRNQQSTRT